MGSYIHFLRHGITEGILKKWYYGWTDLPLLEEGFQQLKDLKIEGIYNQMAEKLGIDLNEAKEEIYDLTERKADFYTSGMLRANQTFKGIFPNRDFLTLPLLKEMNFGNWECKSFEDLQSEPEFDQWMSCTDGSFSYPGGGDSVNSFLSRIDSGMKELLDRHSLLELSLRHKECHANSVVVCHGGVIGSAMQGWFPNQKENFWKWIPEPARGYTIELKDGKPVDFQEI